MSYNRADRSRASYHVMYIYNNNRSFPTSESLRPTFGLAYTTSGRLDPFTYKHVGPMYIAIYKIYAVYSGTGCFPFRL